MTTLARQAPPTIVHSQKPSSRLLDLLGPNHGDMAVPAWAGLLNDQHIEWIVQRWDSATRVFNWQPTDRLASGTVSREVSLASIADLVVLEILTSLAIDDKNGNKAKRTEARKIVKVSSKTRAASIHELPLDSLGVSATTRVREWTTRLDVFTAHPAAEWDRDQIRLAVVKLGTDEARVLDVSRISQRWLRTLLVDVLRSRVLQVAPQTLGAHVVAAARLSAFLGTRRDKGRNPGVLTHQAMSGFSEWLAADPEVTRRTQTNVLKDVRVVLTEARALGFTERIGLSPRFTVRPEHLPKMTVKVRQDRSFPDATFMFLTGQDHILGPRVFELARSVCGEQFTGDVFVQALHTSANYGRRPQEVCELIVDRIRIDDPRCASMFYDNMKVGRDHVWLPMGTYSAAQMATWIPRLRATYPTTPAATLRLLPRATKNPHGTQPLSRTVLTKLFRRWVHLLEQAIVLGHLHEATGAPLTDLCQVRVGDLDSTSMLIGGRAYELATNVRQMIADYCHNLTTRWHPDKVAYAPIAADLPLFPWSYTGTGKSQLVPVAPSRFDGLGPDWLTQTARYRSPGIPGTRLGDERINPDHLQLSQFRHTYLQHLINNGESIFTVAELADHANVQTTIDNYVRETQEKLRDAVEGVEQARLDRYGKRRFVERSEGLLTVEDITGTLGQGEKEDCSRDHTCYECSNWAGDPSNIPEMKANIARWVRTINVHMSLPEHQQKPGQLAYHQEQLDGWRGLLRNIEDHLNLLPPNEKAKVLLAAKIVHEFRAFVARGGINLSRPPSTTIDLRESP